MSLRILDDGETCDFEIAGSTIHYTLCGWGELQEIRNDCRNPDTMRLRDGAVEKRVLLAHTLGWENVLDASGKPVPWSHDALFHLPGWVIDRLVVKILEGVQEEQEEQGNSEGSSTT